MANMFGPGFDSLQLHESDKNGQSENIDHFLFPLKYTSNNRIR
jgi:hypothetical protein